MIIDIPTADDYHTGGLTFLHLAWDTAINLQSEFHYAEIETIDEGGFVTDEYWRAAQGPLTTAATLMGQGVEFLLKARIARESPLLLLSGSPRDWPRGSDQRDTAFSMFRTLDAQDLRRVHDTVCPIRLSDCFAAFVDGVRVKRNRMIHTVDKTQRVAVHEILRDILEVSHYLVGEKRWIAERWKYHPNSPVSVAYTTDHVDAAVNLDVLTSLQVLEPAEVEKYYGFRKKQRRYICLKCRYAIEESDRIHTALLTPAAPGGGRVRCFVCSDENDVRREDCCVESCKGNVISTETNECLTCGAEQ